jgi:hypothetical protein
METRAIHPTTLEGIKRLAGDIKRERSIQHCAALDEAAKAAGFSNLRHAQNALATAPGSQSAARKYHIYITAYWAERNGASGRETLRLRMRAPWKSLVTPRQLADCKRVRLFRALGDDHLCARETLLGQASAQTAVLRAARIMQFLNYTGLVPSRAFRRAYPGGDSVTNRPPGEDHVTLWHDPHTDGYVIADEPYEGPGDSPLSQRKAWCSERGLEVVRPLWPGMHFPEGGTHLYLFAKRGTVDLDRLSALLDRAPTNLCSGEWSGDSAPAKPVFITPSMQSHGISGVRRPPLTQRGSRSTEGYVQTFVGPQRRPKGTMPIGAHREAARLLNEVLLQATRRKGVQSRTDWVRGELDEWCMREYTPADLSGKEFSDLYYGDYGITIRSTPAAGERSSCIERPRRVQKIVCEHYPDCAPLRRLTGKLDLAIASLASWRLENHTLPLARVKVQ